MPSRSPRGAASRWCPVGLTYEDKEHFGSRVLVFVGDPIPVAPYAETYARHGRTAVRELTARMATSWAP
jgi:hypothetical protein